MEIAPAKTGLAAASTWWAAFFRWASAWVAPARPVAEAGHRTQWLSRNSAVLCGRRPSVTASGGLRRHGLNAHQVPVHRGARRGQDRRARGKTVTCCPIGWGTHEPTLRAIFLEVGGAARRLIRYLASTCSLFPCHGQPFRLESSTVVWIIDDRACFFFLQALLDLSINRQVFRLPWENQVWRRHAVQQRTGRLEI